ncbi:MAG: transposase [Lachnospiraceae bacterium]|nr:transposase [Lachnospiraceae bacterium]
MTLAIGPSFSKVKNDIYKNHSEGFYVRAKPNLCTPDVTIKYISRYLGRPVIATSRIDKYDGENVTFHYTRHEDNKTIEECVPAMDFIKRLIVHIPEKHFKMLRYYGIYAKHHKQEKKLRRCISLKRKPFLNAPLTGSIPSCSLLDTTRFGVINAVLPYRFWKFTTKKLHYLNVIEKSWDSDSSVITVTVSQSLNSADPTRTANSHNQRHGEVTPSLFCHVIF